MADKRDFSNEDKKDLLKLIGNLRKDIRGMENSVASIEAQLRMQNAHYQDMALAILNAFEEQDGKIVLVNQDAAAEAFRLADQYYN